jgi:hypothetical protein
MSAALQVVNDVLSDGVMFLMNFDPASSRRALAISTTSGA